jgi:hypothetical protein
MGKASAANARQQRLDEIKKQQAAAARKRALVVWGSVGAVIAIIAGIVGYTIFRDVSGRPTLSAVKSYTYAGAKHTTDKVTYKETPPVGGEHNPVWLNCGVYTKAVPNENAVHSMEHGAVWVTYRPDLPAADVATLQEQIPDTYAILSPYPGLPAPVVASAWGKQIYLDGASDQRLALFMKEYRQSPDAPEPGALCTGGTDGTTTTPGAGDPAVTPSSMAGSPTTSATPSATTTSK